MKPFGDLTKSEYRVITNLLSNPNIKYKKLLEQFLVANTTQSKYRVGECFKVRDPSRKFFGVPAVYMNGTIQDIQLVRSLFSVDYRYTLEVVVMNSDGQLLEAKIYADEVVLTQRTDSNMNFVD